MANKTILVLEGGYNEEHEVSLSTGKEVKKAILELNYDLQSIIVDPKTFNNKIKKFNADICFNALHGTFGEDGKIQRILYDNNLTFSHSGIKASNIAFNKILTKNIIKTKGINFLKSNSLKKSELSNNKLEDFLIKYDSFVIKPVSSGSSYGVQLIKSVENINFFIENAIEQKNIYKNHENIMIEKYIKGKELTVAVIEENKNSKSIDVTEIISNNLLFDYQAKYTKGFSKHFLPASIPNKAYQQCLDYAKIVHDTLGCRGVSRSDFLYNEKDEKIYFLEINTQPGLTPISLVPEQLKKHNIDFTILIDRILKAALCQD